MLIPPNEWSRPFVMYTYRTSRGIRTSFQDLLNILSAKLLQRRTGLLRRRLFELVWAPLTDVDLTESYAEIKYKAPAEHLLTRLTILLNRPDFVFMAECAWGQLTPSIGLIGILNECLECVLLSRSWCMLHLE